MVERRLSGVCPHVPRYSPPGSSAAGLLVALMFPFLIKFYCRFYCFFARRFCHLPPVTGSGMGMFSAGTRTPVFFRCLEPSSPLARQFCRGCLSNCPSTYPLGRAPNSLRGPGLWCLALCTPCHSPPGVA